MEENKTQGSQIQENKMGILPVNRLLISMSVPIMVSMLVQALYNVVDSIFVAKLSENALNAVSLAFPDHSGAVSRLDNRHAGRPSPETGCGRR